MTWKRAAYAYRKNLSLQQHAASVGLVHACMNVSAGLSDANTTLSFWCACFRAVLEGLGILVPDPATVQYGQRYDCKAGSSPCCQVAEHFEKKTQKVMLKIYLGK